MRNNSSLFYQLMTSIGGAMIVFFIVSFVSLYVDVRKEEVTLRNYVLEDHVRAISSHLKIETEGARKGKIVFDIPAQMREFYDSTVEYQYVVRSKQGKVLFSDNGTDDSLFPAEWPTSDEPYFFDFIDKKGIHFFGAGYAQYVADNIYLVQLAVSEDSARAFPKSLTFTLLYNMAIRTFLFYALLTAILYWRIRRSLLPLNIASAEAEKISISSADFRISDANLPQEMRPLVKAFNKALSRLEMGIRFERDFIANAAHELRTPLSIIRCHAEAIKDKAVSLPLLRDIDSLSHLMKQLLDKAKLSGIQPNSFERVDLRHIVQSVCSDMGPLLVRENRSLEVTDANTPAIVLGDEWSIYRALANLLGNAINHTPKGTGIEISLRDLAISVRDHGPGILPENRDKIFEGFWRQDATKAEGSGLGLAIVKKTMELHGGTVSVENASDGGAVFTLKFPMPPVYPPDSAL